MRLVLVPCLIAYTLTGCKDSSSSSANTGDVAIDFIIDNSNGHFKDGLANADQRNKYVTPLVGTKCVAKMTKATEKLMKSKSLKELLSSDAQVQYQKLIKAAPDTRVAQIKQTAESYCKIINGWK